MLVAMGQVIGFDSTLKVMTGHDQIALPECAHAEEISAFTRAQVLSQAATAMLAQANETPANLLRLFQ